MRVSWLADVLRGAGLNVIEQPGWKGRGQSFADGLQIAGVVAHHTASNKGSGNAPSLGIVTNGRSDLPGPLAQLVLGRDGTFYCIADGRANHAGSGSYPGWPSSANSTAIGIEAELDGIGEMSSCKFLDAYAAGTAAILEYVGRTSDAVILHLEWRDPPGSKIDPRGPWEDGAGGEDWWTGQFDVNARSGAAFRARVEEHMAGLTPEQSAKIDKILDLCDNILRPKLDAVYWEVADETPSAGSMGGRLVTVEREVKGSIGAHLAGPERDHDG